MTYWGDDAGARRFDVQVNGETVATEHLDRREPGNFFDVDYPLNKAQIKDGAQIAVRFQAYPGNMAGGIFGLRLLCPEEH